MQYCQRCGELGHLASRCTAEPSPNTASPNKRTSKALTGAERNARWRAKHPERHREYMRNYMAERRAAGRRDQ